MRSLQPRRSSPGGALRPPTRLVLLPLIHSADIYWVPTVCTRNRLERSLGFGGCGVYVLRGPCAASRGPGSSTLLPWIIRLRGSLATQAVPPPRRARNLACPRFPNGLSVGCQRQQPYHVGLARSCSIAQSCPTLCGPVDCGPAGSSVPGVFQIRILEWGAISYFTGT